MMKLATLIMSAVLFTFFSCMKSNHSEKTQTKTLVEDTLKIKKEISKKDSDKDLLVSDDLKIIMSLNEDSLTKFFENEEILTKYLKLELIDKSLFENKRNTAVNFLVEDTTAIKKINGITELKCKDKTIKYIDNPNDNEEMEIFNYLGRIDFLNKYLIACSYYEDGEYKFVDKTSGAETTTFADYPFISPNQKNIICINSNGYESTADLELYSIEGKSVKRVMSASFSKWMPIMENEEMFWSKDGYLYLIVHNTKTFWMENGLYNDKYQYIRIKVL